MLRFVGLVSLLTACVLSSVSCGVGQEFQRQESWDVLSAPVPPQGPAWNFVAREGDDLSSRAERLTQNGGSGAGNEATGAGRASRYDPSLIQAGAAAFNNYCTQCHDAERALQKTKSLAQWRATVRRMAEKDGADVPKSEHEAIATYLASRTDTGEGGGAAASGEAPPFALTGTVAPLWRGGGNSALQNAGFFPDVWVGAAWQSKGPLSARATACLSCHNETPYLSRLELVEAAVRFDVSKWLASHCGSDCEPQAKIAVEAGRFVVPFGAFYQETNPSVYRTVTKPLIYNMGQRVRANDLGDTVLPMPYADEGAALDVSLPIFETITATLNAYVVNGLQGSPFGLDFLTSRDYVDNNWNAAPGGRLTVGGKHFRFGGSVTGGAFDVPQAGGPIAQRMDYLIYGADALFRWENLLRIQFEYAQREADGLAFIPDLTVIRERVGGWYLEGEFPLCRSWHLNFIARYDEQTRRSPVPPPASTLPIGEFTVGRFTYGLAWTLPGGSLLMINHERWFMPGNLRDVDVLGVRWAATF